MLYLVSTPIGNLKDITLRALEILKSVDLILCEDTRTSKVLLDHYEISKPLKSLHKFSEKKQIDELIDELKNGKTFALISDAGTPAISDPGEILVAACVSQGISVSPIPGPSALIAALSSSSLATEPFQFLGFVPKKSQERRIFLFNALLYNGTSIVYESPQRILDTLAELKELDKNRKIVLAREITKKFETIYRGTAQEIFETLSKTEPRGEIVLLIAASVNFQEIFSDIDSKKLVDYCQERLNLDRKEAIRLAADLSFKDRRSIYKELIS